MHLHILLTCCGLYVYAILKRGLQVIKHHSYFNIEIESFYSGKNKNVIISDSIVSSDADKGTVSNRVEPQTISLKLLRRDFK